MKVDALQNNIESIGSRITWTGSSFDGFELIKCENPHHFESTSDGQASHSYTLFFGTPLNCGNQAEFEIKANMKDSRRIMVPYYAQEVTANMEYLRISIHAPEGLLQEAKKVMYTDTGMTKNLEVLRESIVLEPDPIGEKFVFDVQKPNLMYGYAIEWIFDDLDEPVMSE